MERDHHYKATITWTGNKGDGTKDYGSYSRDHVISIDGKQDITGSSDPAFRGNKSMHNPEDLLIASLSACHMLWYLHLCAENGITVVEYKDEATGTMRLNSEGGGQFIEVTLRPIATITDQAQIEKANTLHKTANKMCFIANSCNFPVLHIPTCKQQ